MMTKEVKDYIYRLLDTNHKEKEDHLAFVWAVKSNKEVLEKAIKKADISRQALNDFILENYDD